MFEEIMNKKQLIIIWIIGIFFLTSCTILFCQTALAAGRRSKRIDEQPMYGGYDRQADKRFKKADEEFISRVVKGSGSREKGSELFVEQGVRFYQQDEYGMAMRRFNQAWLLNPANPDVFWGFAIIFHDEENAVEAKKMIDKALELNLSKPIALADAGRIYTLFAFADKPTEQRIKDECKQRANQLYERAIASAPGNDYIYESWAHSLYYQGDYAGAWKKIKEVRKSGQTINAWLINHLEEKMPEQKDK